MIREDLRRYIEQEILPLYDAFDRGHRRDHAHQVIERSAQLAEAFDVDAEMVYAIAAYHDTGLRFGRENHHSDSARIVLADGELRRWFTEEQIVTIAQAAEDHRASAARAPRSIYGRIVAEADRLIIPELIIRRTVQYSLANFPALDREGHWLRSQEHLHEKYDEGGYLRLWIEGSDNAERLERLREIIADKEQLREIFDKIFDEEQNKKEPV
ncbi:MAG: HD domain-containing protein [Alistipes sp.]|nr:HD domain-containing protein [Alistipes sp.]MBP3473939.1 HD domain-containing protein [Alistipes sp.]MDO5487926.1 HD domain-containing protein [Rikenellaceae bacterium]